MATRPEGCAISRVGASTTIFSVIYNVLLDLFPYTDAKRVVAIQIHDLATGRAGGRQYLQTAEFLDYEAQNHGFAEPIGGTFQDVLQSTNEGTEQFSGDLSLRYSHAATRSMSFYKAVSSSEATLGTGKELRAETS